jgi:hypothetical protein
MEAQFKKAPALYHPQISGSINNSNYSILPTRELKGEVKASARDQFRTDDVKISNRDRFRRD